MVRFPVFDRHLNFFCPQVFICCPFCQGHKFIITGKAQGNNLARIVGLTWPENVPSQRVLEKIGMRRESDAEHYGRTMRVYAATRP